MSTNDLYTFLTFDSTVIFQDSGPNNNLNASATLNILIEDADDLPAEFSPSSYSAEVQENAAKVNLVAIASRSGAYRVGLRGGGEMPLSYSTILLISLVAFILGGQDSQ